MRVKIDSIVTLDYEFGRHAPGEIWCRHGNRWIRTDRVYRWDTRYCIVYPDSTVVFDPKKLHIKYLLTTVVATGAAMGGAAPECHPQSEGGSGSVGIVRSERGY